MYRLQIFMVGAIVTCGLRSIGVGRRKYSSTLFSLVSDGSEC